MLLHVLHTTAYHYAPQVETAQHMAHLLPRSMPSQTVRNADLNITPTPAARSDHIDVFGNMRSFFSLPVAHASLQIVASSLVETHRSMFDPDHIAQTPAWEKVREHFVYHAGAAWDAANEYVFASPYVTPHADFAEYARASFTPQRPVLAAACDLMTRIHQEFEYASKSTDVNTRRLKLWPNGKASAKTLPTSCSVVCAPKAWLHAMSAAICSPPHPKGKSV